jgi:hypothetical protein
MRVVTIHLQEKSLILEMCRSLPFISSVTPIILNEDPLPWGNGVKYFGNILENNNPMRTEYLAFFGKVNSLLHEFHYIDLSVMMKVLDIYVTAFNGNSL